MLGALPTYMREMASATELPTRSQADSLFWIPKREGKYSCFVSLHFDASLYLISEC